MRFLTLGMLLLLLPVAVAAQDRSVELRRGMVITSSIRVTPGVYQLAASPSMDSAVLVIRGNDITVDFAGATLQGTPLSAHPDQATGVAIRIDGGTNVHVINATVRGYKVGLIARGTRNLVLADNDFSHNWKARLFSLIEHESLVDWMSHHKNEQDEWLRFGAGIYLTDVRGGEIRGNRIVQGMEGLMMTRTDSVLIWNNTIEFNSGVGIGLYRSSYNRIMHNHASYNVRGYSHGFFRRGQDSADLLMYEQSSNNVVAFNSMTHGGDGLFLWAGQSTMDTGKGGSNDNLFYANDFSFAPTNAMEATFSRNRFIGNRAEGSDHGLWGGYSFDSEVAGNSFAGNRIGIAIEHGQNNRITGNHFFLDSTAIYLWANPIEPSEWAYPKTRDTRSRDYTVTDNAFLANRVALRIANTFGGQASGNQYIGVDSSYVVKDTSTIRLAQADTVRMSGLPGVRFSDTLETPPEYADTTGMPSPLAGGLALSADSLARMPRSAIIVDEWGPYDYRSPKLWPADSSRTNPLKLRVLGPAGSWTVVSKRGVASVSKERGVVNDTVVVTPANPRDWDITLEYRGGATESPRGEKRAAGVPYRFTYSVFEPVTTWNVAFHVYPDSADPRTQADRFAAVLRGTPVATQTVPRLDYMWYRPTIPNVPQAKFAAVATATVTLAAGDYTLRTISDDGVRVFVDGKMVIDDWKGHESALAYAPISAGRHEIRVEYYQIDGWTELRLDILRGRQDSAGSPGPH